MWYEMVEQLLKQLMTLLSVDLSYFSQRVPVVKDIATIFLAVGWALLIGNLAYQALRSMVSGIGIEAEEPGRLFLRTATFSFLLVCSRQICNLGLGLSAVVMQLLQVPKAVSFTPFNEDFFSTLPNAGWLVVIVVNVYIQWQIIKLFFEVAERYVILCVLVYCAPMAFAMGGSKSTAEIFRGWLRMFSSMCVLMVLNVMFVKMLLSAMSNSPAGVAVVPWVMLITGIVRMAKKMDGIIMRIGLNPAMTGDPLGRHHIPGVLSAMMIHHAASFIKSTISNPPHAANTAQPRYDSPLAYGMDRQVSNGRITEIGASVGNGTQSHEAEHSSETHNNANTGSSGKMGMLQRTVSARVPHQYADINIEADDFIDGESISQMSSTAQTGYSRVSPIAPRTQLLPRDFAESKAPISPQTARPPVTPQAQHTNSAMQTAQNIPQSIMQNANTQNTAESPLTEHGIEQTTAVQPQTIEHSTQTEKNGGTHGQQAGRISPVAPPRPVMDREVQKTAHTAENHSSMQVQNSSNHEAVNHMQRKTEEKAAQAGANVSPSIAQAAKRLETPVAVKQAFSSVRRGKAVRQTAVQAVKPDVMPQRGRGVSAAVRPDISPVSARSPETKRQRTERKPINPVSPVSQPRVLRRSAEPVQSKNVTPRNGGDRNARRKPKP